MSVFMKIKDKKSKYWMFMAELSGGFNVNFPFQIYNIFCSFQDSEILNVELDTYSICR